VNINYEQKVKDWDNFYRINNYYHKSLESYLKLLIPEDAKVLEFGCRKGEFLNSLENIDKTGVDYYEFIKHLKKSKSWNYVDYRHVGGLKKRFDYIILSDTLSELENIQSFIGDIAGFCHDQTKVIVLSYNYLWKPILDLSSFIGLHMKPIKEPNWLTEQDIDNIFSLEHFEKVKSAKFFFFPYNLGILSELLNKYLSRLPVIDRLCLQNVIVYQPLKGKSEYSVSLVIPARNEAGNIKGVLKKIPVMGKKTEVIFVEGNSKDNTFKAINDEIINYKGPIKASLYKQKGKGKGDAVRMGFSKAKNDLLMILDADLTVDPMELTKFYQAVSDGKGEFVMGSRLVYPMEKQAMRTLNYIGNKFFSITFSYLLGQKVKDTLCGTKVILKENYEKIKKNRSYFGDFDPFGDFDLIFGASKLNLKIIEIPVRYKQRTYGETNISRFKHGLLLLKMSLFAAIKLKFI